MIQLADAGHKVATLLKRLRQRHHIGNVLTKLRRVLVDPRVVRTQTGQERRSTRVAQRELAVRPIKPHPLLRQPVDVRRLVDLRPVGADRVRRMVVGENKEDVGPVRRRLPDSHFALDLVRRARDRCGTCPPRRRRPRRKLDRPAAAVVVPRRVVAVLRRGARHRRRPPTTVAAVCAGRRRCKPADLPPQRRTLRLPGQRKRGRATRVQPLLQPARQRLLQANTRG